MARKRIDMHRLQELVWLHRTGTKTREISRILKMSPNTQRNYRRALEQYKLLNGDPMDIPDFETLKNAVICAMPSPKLPKQQRSRIESFRPQIEKLLEAGLGPKVLWQRLIELTRDSEKPFEGSYSQVKRMCRTILQKKGVDPKAVAIVVESKPGEVAQVDFGYVGKLFDPETKTMRKAWCFVMVLSFSRHMAVRVVFDQKNETWLRLHIECFEELGGVASIVRPDNLKPAVIRAAFCAEQSTELNRSYRELARHYGFKVDPTPPYSPKKKGKVESAVKYIKNSFFKGREEQDINELRALLPGWTNETAGLRIHGTTGKQPKVVFEQIEKEHLLPLPDQLFELVIWKQAKVHQDTHIAFDGRLYSVPWTLVGSTVWIRATKSTIVVYADDQRVATHSREGETRRNTIEQHLPEHRRQWRHRNREHWEQAADAMGEQVGQLIREIFDSDEVLYQLRTVQSVMKLLESYPKERAEAACARASFYGITNYGSIKRILVNELDHQPLPMAVEIPSGPLSSPRFARNVPELIGLASQEVNDEPH